MHASFQRPAHTHIHTRALTHTHTHTHTHIHTHTHTHTRLVLVLVDTAIRSRVLNEEATTTTRDRSTDDVLDHPPGESSESRLHTQTGNWNDHWLLDAKVLRRTDAAGNLAWTYNTDHTWSNELNSKTIRTDEAQPQMPVQMMKEKIQMLLVPYRTYEQVSPQHSSPEPSSTPGTLLTTSLKSHWKCTLCRTLMAVAIGLSAKRTPTDLTINVLGWLLIITSRSVKLSPLGPNLSYRVPGVTSDITPTQIAPSQIPPT